MKQSISFIAAFVFLGCGDGTEDKSSETPEKSTAITGATGSKFGSGVYSFNVTSPTTTTCTDGSSNTATNRIAMNVAVTFSDNSLITITGVPGDNSSQNTLTASGITASLSGYSGIVESNGSFSARQTGRGTSVDYGTLILTYNLTGNFDGTRWWGSYEYQILFYSYNTTCTYRTTFYGSKVS